MVAKALLLIDPDTENKGLTRFHCNRLNSFGKFLWLPFSTTWGHFSIRCYRCSQGGGSVVGAEGGGGGEDSSFKINKVVQLLFKLLNNWARA